MLASQKTIAVAESVTSGHLQAALSQADNAKHFFQGGITVYNLGQKSRHLHIEPIEAEACDCVSQPVTDQMALQVPVLFSSHIGVAITGYATTVPQKNIHGLFAFYAISFLGKIIDKDKITAPPLNALDAQLYFTDAVLEKLLKLEKTISGAAQP